MKLFAYFKKRKHHFFSFDNLVGVLFLTLIFSVVFFSIQIEEEPFIDVYSHFSSSIYVVIGFVVFNFFFVNFILTKPDKIENSTQSKDKDEIIFMGIGSKKKMKENHKRNTSLLANSLYSKHFNDNKEIHNKLTVIKDKLELVDEHFEEFELDMKHRIRTLIKRDLHMVLMEYIAFSDSLKGKKHKELVSTLDNVIKILDKEYITIIEDECTVSFDKHSYLIKN